MKKNNVFYVKALVISAMMVALAYVLGLFSINVTSTFKISVAAMPIHLVGLLLGPIWGGISGLVIDLVQIFLGSGATGVNLFTLASIMGGLIPGLFYLVFKDKVYKNVVLLVIILTVTLLTSTVINTIALNVHFGSPYSALLSYPVLGPKILQIVIKVVVYTILFKAILPTTAKFVNK